MAVPLNAHDAPDLSASTSFSHTDFSLGSFTSGLSTPHRSAATANALLKAASGTSSAMAAVTPSGFVNGYGHRITTTPRRTKSTGGEGGKGAVGDYASLLHTEEEDDGDGAAQDVLHTPAVVAEEASGMGTRMRSGTLTTATASASNPATSKVSKLTLRDQEKHIDNLKKENFSIKLRVHFLEDQLARLAPDQMEAALKQNINLKIEVQQRGMEIKKLKKLVLSLEHELERLQRGPSSYSSPAPLITSNGPRQRERDLEERLEERERELRDLRRRKAERDDDDDALLRGAESRNAELEEELDNVKSLLEENLDEIHRLHNLVERGGAGVGERSTPAPALANHTEELENENQDLREKVEGQEVLIGRLQDNRDELADALSALQLQLEELQQRRHSESLERSASRAALLSEQEEREELEGEVNRLRDRVAALMIELQTKEDELDRGKGDMEEFLEEHKKIVEAVEEDWRGEVEEAHGQNEELKDVLAERDNECRELRISVSELEANQNDLHGKYEGAIAQLEEELEERQRELEDRDLQLERRDAEMEEVRATIDKLGEQVYLLEDDNDRLKEDFDKARDEDGLERDRLEGVVNALKDKNANLKTQIQALQEAYDQAKHDAQDHLTRQEELAKHIELLVAELESERSQREHTQSDLTALSKEFDADAHSAKRTLEAKEAALQTALADLARMHARFNEREADLTRIQEALEEKARESRALGESVTSARFGLELEVERLRGDLERSEGEVGRFKVDVGVKEGALDRVYQENREIAGELAAAMQARLNLSDKLDAVQKIVREREGEVGVLKGRVGELEGRAAKDQRALVQVEGMYRDQLTERNTLLLTIYQYLDKILGVDRTPKKGTQAETKPFTNFSVFHDNLITRLKALSQIQLEFDKRVRELEGKFFERLGEMKRHIETRWRQVDKFEASVKLFAETKAQWRNKLKVKEGELDAFKATNSELSAQLSTIKRPNASDTMEVRSWMARAMNAERRLNIAQNQLVASEEKVASVTQRSGTADEKWEARVREYEARLKAAEEKVKRERQGSKERVAELEAAISKLKQQLNMAQKRSGQLGEVLETTSKAAASSSSSPNR